MASDAAGRPAATALVVVAFEVAAIGVVGAFDWPVFATIDKLARPMRPATMIMSGIVFAILLTTLAVQVFVSGAGALGRVGAGRSAEEAGLRRLPARR